MRQKSFFFTREFHFSLIGFLALSLALLNVIAFYFDEDFTKLLYGDGINYDDAEEVHAREEGYELAKKIEEESIVLLKNEHHCLPLSSKKVNVFGVGSCDTLFVHQGGGSAKTSDYGKVSFYQSLSTAGLELNPRLVEFYNSKSFNPNRNSVIASMQFRNYELAPITYDESLFTSAEEFSTTAIYVLSRPAIEKLDIPTVSYSRNGQQQDARPTLALSENEEWLLNKLQVHFPHIILVLNTGNPMELPFYDSAQIDAIINMGYPGNAGVVSLGKILLGEASPSGRTVDTFATSIYSNPATINAGANGSHAYPNQAKAHYIDYEESVYVGYRYYETLFEEANLSEEEYRRIVAFPFGHGLSYTQFSWQVLSSEVIHPDGTKEPLGHDANVDGEGAISFGVWVENIGSRAGNDVVEIYAHIPYYKGGIEKPSIALAGFAKTKTLKPGQGEKLTIEIPLRSLASYDCYDRNNNGFIGYELEHGSYALSFRKNAHEVHPLVNANSDFTFNIRRAGYTYPNDEKTGENIRNLFTEMDNETSGAASEIQEETATLAYSIDGENKSDLHFLTREDFKQTFPKEKAIRAMNDTMLRLNYPVGEPKNDPDATRPAFDKNLGMRITDAFGKDYDDVTYDFLVSTLHEDEAIHLVQHAGFGTSELSSIGKPRCLDLDGPCGLNTSVLSSSPGNATSYPSTATLAQSFNRELCYDYGRAIGKEAKALGINGWYAPGANIHRSPLGGRNFEYFSEDPFLSGHCAAYVIRGAKDAGLYCYLKHFAVDTQESGQNGQYQWMSEQALREIYAKPFEIAVKLAEANGVMLSKDRIGSVRSAGSDALIEKLLRKEWGFEGAVITDYYVGGNVMSADEAIRAGVDLILEGSTVTFVDTSSPTFFSNIARACRNVLYCYASTMYAANIANDLPFDHYTGAKNEIRATWKPILITVDVITVPLLGVYAFFTKRKFSKDSPENYV